VSQIESVHARQILDSRGNPTVEVDVGLRSGAQGHPAYRRVALEMHRLIGEQAGHHIVADAMTHMTTEAPELERLDAERRMQARRGPR